MHRQWFVDRCLTTGSLDKECVCIHTHIFIWASLIAQWVKNPPAIQETLVRFLGWEYLLEKG